MKKKQFFFAWLLTVAIATLGLSSCSNDLAPDEPTREGMVDVVMTTSLPQALQSYAASSAESGLANLEGQNLYVRYIMEVYTKTSSTEPVVRKICYKPLVADGDYKTASFQTRLVAAQYNFVFWADIVKEVNKMDYSAETPGVTAPFYANRYFISNKDEESDVLLHATYTDTYSDGSLQEISANVLGDGSLAHLTGEMYDGYTANEIIDLRSEATTKSITLKRPFAKLRVITTDADVLEQQGINLETINMALQYGTNIPSTYNALTKASSGVANLNALYKNNAIYDDESGKQNEKTVGVIYCLIPTQVENMTLNLGVLGSSIYDNISVDVENVPLVANKLTTIKGNLFSKNATINVTIDDEFEKDDEGNIDETIVEYGKEASTVDELMSKLSGKDEAIMYTGKVTKAKGFELDFTNVARTTPVYADGNTATLTIKFPSIEEGAVFTFTGANAPQTLRIVTDDTKCSVRVNLTGSKVYYDGSAYKYIVTNVGSAGRRSDMQYDALFYVSAAFTSAVNAKEKHQVKINSDFTLPEDAKCIGAKLHTDKTCNFLEEVVNPWLSSNSGKNIWDFVGAN